MKKEIDLLSKYPKPNRNIEERVKKKSNRDRNIARKFGKDFFDGKGNTVTEDFHITLDFGAKLFWILKNTGN